MSFYDWLLFAHIATAFALVAALVTFWVVAVAARDVDRPSDSARDFRVTKPANVLVIVGTIGTLLLGIWLAIDAEAYQVWDGWIIAAIVLWAISAGTGQRGGVTYARGAEARRTTRLRRVAATSPARSFGRCCKTGGPRCSTSCPRSPSS